MTVGKYAGLNPLDRLREGEPWFFLRAQDMFSLPAVKGYASGLYAEALDREQRGDHEIAFSLHEQVREILELAQSFAEWQENNPDLVKIPD